MATLPLTSTEPTRPPPGLPTPILLPPPSHLCSKRQSSAPYPPPASHKLIRASYYPPAHSPFTYRFGQTDRRLLHVPTHVRVLDPYVARVHRSQPGPLDWSAGRGGTCSGGESEEAKVGGTARRAAPHPPPRSCWVLGQAPRSSWVLGRAPRSC